MLVEVGFVSDCTSIKCVYYKNFVTNETIK